MKAVILTTNYNEDQTKKHYSERVIDRLRGSDYEEAVFLGPSHR